MLKGINKRVIVIKNLNSEIIEEAYFILKNNKGIFKTLKENEMIAEANKIISEYHSQQKPFFERGDSAQGTKSESDTAVTSHVSNLANLSDEEIFEDSKILEHIQGTVTPKDYFHDLNFNVGNLPGNNLKFNFNSLKRPKRKVLRSPSKAFFAGIGVMSAIVILIKLIEYMTGI